MSKTKSTNSLLSTTSGRKTTKQGQGKNSRPKGNRKMMRGQGK